MNTPLQKRIEQKINEELTRTKEELKLIDINLNLLENKKNHLKEMVVDWQIILDELSVKSPRS